jgi:predicted dienelactone hydrolase
MSAPSIPLSTEAALGEAVPPRSYSWLRTLNNFSRGILWSAVIVSALLAVEFDFGVPRILIAAVMGFLGFAIISLGEGIAILLWKILRLLFRLFRFATGLRFLEALPAVPVGRIVGAFIYIAGDLLWPDTFFQHITLPIVGEITIVLGGLTVTMVGLARMDGRTRTAQIALAGIPVLLILAFAVWVINPGYDNYLAAPVPAVSPAPNVENPGLPGPYAVQTLSYGSGSSGRRPEFGKEAALITPAVDGSRIFPGYSGLADSYFQWYWDFDFSRLPLNGSVWYPEGNGPFPLVLIVHGNHAMSDYSDPGYAYLAEHLASQGYIAVSVDENFLNGLFFFDGEMEEMPLRAWLLLQHLEQWQSWNETDGNPFTGKVNMDQIALIGHSRGGEAVAWAAHMNWKSMPPVSAVSSPDDFSFNIRGVVSIAPSDAYGGTGRRKPTLDHSNYLLLAGGHDADTFVLYGQQQYNRVQLKNNPDGFKALAYLYQANHGQFNTVWGDSDRGVYNSWLLNRAPLLTAEAQQQAAKVIITSFLNAALQDERQYRELFRQPGTAASWLPEGILVTHYQDASFIAVDTNNGSTALAATELAGAKATVQDISFAKVESLKLRDGETNQGNKALHLVWETGSRPIYAITLPVEETAAWQLSADYAFTFALAAVPGQLLPNDLIIELETTSGETSRLTLTDLSSLPSLLPAHLVKVRWLSGMNGFPGDIVPEEIILQSYTLPLADFQAANPDFDPAELQAIRFLLDGTSAGAIYLDEIGFNIAAHSR